MIIGLGTDITELARIRTACERFGGRFLHRILTGTELAALPAAPTAYIAGRFAAKEAAVKALGSGFSMGIAFTHIEVLRGSQGQPQLRLLGPARERADRLGVGTAHVSISHGRDAAVAVVVLEA
ncbi:MAG: holo-[acyl-carrier-protein] synthase [Desulfovibrio desulfuricans]|nr:holo-[acyl-carrier-protein] synthase [Desulfovibrio desulfuricans]